MKQIPAWNREALLRSSLFAPLHPILAELDSDSFPELEDCNALLAARHPPVAVQSGKLLRFVPHQSGRLPFEMQYEPRCYLSGEVSTRADNWHDLFNAMVWLTFPNTKAILNARHYHAQMEKSVSRNAGRGAVRDVNTLFDESGVIVAYTDEDLAGLLRRFRWKELFWQRREQVRKNMGFFLFGHGLYEKALQPYPGMTGQGLLIRVAQVFYSWTPARQMGHLDSLLAGYLGVPGHCRSTRDLSPVPLLGVPEWAADNVQESYYENTEYFRPGRRA
jgi:hypothetical protein